MKKINLLSPEFLYRKIENNTVKILLLVMVAFLVYTAYLVHDVQQESKGLVQNYEIEDKIAKLEESIEKTQKEIDSQVKYLTELKKNYFPYKDIVEFFAKRTPEDMMILAVFDQGETLVTRGVAEEHRAIAQMVNSLESNLEVENIKITELINKEDLQLFELQFQRKVDVDE